MSARRAAWLPEAGFTLGPKRGEALERFALHPHLFPRGNEGARIVTRTFLAVIVCLAAIAFLALFLADREIQAGIRRLSNYRFPPHSALEADPGLTFARRAERGRTPGSHGAAYLSMCRDPSQSCGGGSALRASIRLSRAVDGPSPGMASSEA